MLVTLQEPYPQFRDAWPTSILHGTIPESIGKLTLLTRLSLPYNNLEGALPASIGSLSLLQIIYLHHMYLTGTIPSEIGRLSTSLTELQFNSNSLVGAIPSSICGLTQLTSLLLSYNKLTCYPSCFSIFDAFSEVFGNADSFTVCAWFIMQTIESYGLFEAILLSKIEKIAFCHYLLLVALNLSVY